MQRSQQTLIALSAGLLIFTSPVFALTFPEWQATKFTAGELAVPSVSGANADPDGDGRQNLLEYAFGLDPLVPDTQPSSQTFGPNGLTLIFPENNAATDLLYHLEESPDLQHWITPNTTTRAVLSSNATTRTVSLFNPSAPVALLKWFNRLQVLLTPDGAEVLAAPTRLEGVLKIPLKITLAWNDLTKIESGFAIERRIGPNGPWQEIGVALADTNRFEDTDIAGSTEYHYRISAIQGSYASDYSEEITLTTPLDTDQDGIPDDAEAGYSTNPMLFSSGNNGIADGWWISYGLSPFGDPNADPDGDGRNNYQEFLDGTDPTKSDSTPNPGATAPLAASDLTLTTLDNGHNELKWKNNGAAVGNIIERNQGGPTWQTVGVVSGTETTFTDATSLPDLVYFYRVKAFN